MPHPRPPQLTDHQRDFINRLEAGEESPAQVLAHGSGRSIYFVRWLRESRFRRRFSKLLIAARQRREFLLTLSSVRAAERLAGCIDDRKLLTINQRQACVELIKLARSTPTMPQRQLRISARTKESEKSAPTSLIHPDSLDDAQALLGHFTDTKPPTCSDHPDAEG